MNAVALTNPLAITAGEPAGIGPDLCVQLAAAPPDIPFVVIADKDLLLQRAAQLGIILRVQDHVAGQNISAQKGSLSVIHVPLVAPCHTGFRVTGYRDAGTRRHLVPAELDRLLDP